MCVCVCVCDTPLFASFLKTETPSLLPHSLKFSLQLKPSRTPSSLCYHLTASIFLYSDSGRTSQQDSLQLLLQLPSS